MAREKDKRRRWALIAGIAFVVFVLGLAAAWRWTPLHEIAEPRKISAWLKDASDEGWMPLLVAFVYIAASFLMFPNTVLCLAVILALGPIAGTAYAFGGSLTAASVGYSLGRWGGKWIKKLKVGAIDRASAQLRKGGGFAQVLLIRIVPVAPFSATNIVCGAAHVRIVSFLAATAIGIAPYILMFAAFGRQTRQLFSHPTPGGIAIVVGIIAVAAVAAWWTHRLAKRREK